MSSVCVPKLKRRDVRGRKLFSLDFYWVNYYTQALQKISRTKHRYTEHGFRQWWTPNRKEFSPLRNFGKNTKRLGQKWSGRMKFKAKGSSDVRRAFSSLARPIGIVYCGCGTCSRHNLKFFWCQVHEDKFMRTSWQGKFFSENEFMRSSSWDNCFGIPVAWSLSCWTFRFLRSSNLKSKLLNLQVPEVEFMRISSWEQADKSMRLSSWDLGLMTSWAPEFLRSWGWVHDR